MAKFEIKGKTGAAIWIAAILLLIPALLCWVGYYWYVISYGYNLVIAPLFNTPHINMWVAGGFATLFGLFFSSMSMELNSLPSKVGASYLAVPFIAHFMLWLLVG